MRLTLAGALARTPSEWWLLYALLVLEVADLAGHTADLWTRSTPTLTLGECEGACASVGLAAYGMDRCECAVGQGVDRAREK